jgi:hypothetical protein
MVVRKTIPCTRSATPSHLPVTIMNRGGRANRRLARAAAGPTRRKRLVGRGPGLERLASWAADVAAGPGQGRARLVEVSRGSARSVLLQASRDRAIEAGCAVFWSAGDELSQPFPPLPLALLHYRRPGAVNGHVAVALSRVP